MRTKWTAWKAQYDQFVEKRGFFFIIGTCVAVIAASAMLSGHTTLSASVAPTFPPVDARSAAQLMQESLESAMAAQPTATPAPAVWHAPLDSIEVLRAFDDTRLQYASETGIWALHDAADLRAETGAIVRAMADGVVTQAAEKGIEGACVTVDHGEGICAVYAGMSLLGGVRAGDPVTAGQTLGFVGSGLLAERDMEPHLHLRVTRDGVAIDPMLLLGR